MVGFRDGTFLEQAVDPLKIAPGVLKINLVLLKGGPGPGNFGLQYL